MVKPVKQDGRKPYTSPILTVYGTVRELTQKVGLVRHTDGGRFPRPRTSLR